VFLLAERAADSNGESEERRGLWVGWAVDEARAHGGILKLPVCSVLGSHALEGCRVHALEQTVVGHDARYSCVDRRMLCRSSRSIMVTD
jgi:hypothetical protein